MRKTATYYFLVMGVLNVLLAHFNAHLTPFMQDAYGSLFGGKPLPNLTAAFLLHYWWAYIFVVLNVIGFVAGLISQLQDRVLLHCVIILLFVEGFVLFCASVAYMLPLTTGFLRMGA